jgi:hypothetical protein
MLRNLNFWYVLKAEGDYQSCHIYSSLRLSVCPQRTTRNPPEKFT